jgi:hypothetical protein
MPATACPLGHSDVAYWKMREWRQSRGIMTKLPDHTNRDFGRCPLLNTGSQRDPDIAQASTAKPTTMRYSAKGANPRLRTQRMNQATTA